MEAEILKTLLKETRENGQLLARIDERVEHLTVRASEAEKRDFDHEERISSLEAPIKGRKWLFGIVIGIGTIAGVVQALAALR